MNSNRRDLLLEVRDLHVQFETREGIVTAVSGVNIELEQGKTLAVLGESGSGKSVTAKALMGLLPNSASVWSDGMIFDGEDLSGLSVSEMRKKRGPDIAMVFQDSLSALNPVLKVGRQIGEMFTRHEGLSKRAARVAAIELMKQVGIPDAASRVDDYPHQFSGGMRQRAMIAMAIALRPRLLIADEPTTALDVTVEAQIMALLQELTSNSGMSMIMITHDLGVVADVADTVVVMYAGRVAEAGPTRDVYENPAHPYTQGLIASVPLLDAATQDVVPIAGRPPSPLQLPPGCKFHPRCPLVEGQCVAMEPTMRDVNGLPATHRAACHLAEKALSLI